MANVAYFGASAGDFGISYSRDAFRTLSQLGGRDRNLFRAELDAMRMADGQDELLAASRFVRRLANGLRVIFEREGSALTILAISQGTTTSPSKGHAQ